MQHRIQTYYSHSKNHYFLSLENGCVIDSGLRGSAARFANHSCNPNSEMQKWYVHGVPRIGLFASDSIPTGTELTYDYNFDWFEGAKMQPCLCGASNCRGYIGKRWSSQNLTLNELPFDYYQNSDSPSYKKRSFSKKRPKSHSSTNIDTSKKVHKSTNTQTSSPSNSQRSSPIFQQKVVLKMKSSTLESVNKACLLAALNKKNHNSNPAKANAQNDTSITSTQNATPSTKSTNNLTNQTTESPKHPKQTTQQNEQNVSDFSLIEDDSDDEKIVTISSSRLSRRKSTARPIKRRKATNTIVSDDEDNEPASVKNKSLKTTLKSRPNIIDSSKRAPLRTFQTKSHSFSHQQPGKNGGHSNNSPSLDVSSTKSKQIAGVFTLPASEDASSDKSAGKSVRQYPLIAKAPIQSHIVPAFANKTGTSPTSTLLKPVNIAPKPVHSNVDVKSQPSTVITPQKEKKSKSFGLNKDSKHSTSSRNLASNISLANSIKSDSPSSIGIHASADSNSQSTLVSNESNMLATPPNQDIRPISNFVEETSKSHIVLSPALASQKPLEVDNCKNAQPNNKAQTVYVTDHFKSCNSSQNLTFVGQPSDNHLSPLVGPVSSFGDRNDVSYSISRHSSSGNQYDPSPTSLYPQYSLSRKLVSNIPNAELQQQPQPQSQLQPQPQTFEPQYPRYSESHINYGPPAIVNSTKPTFSNYQLGIPVQTPAVGPDRVSYFGPTPSLDSHSSEYSEHNYRHQYSSNVHQISSLPAHHNPAQQERRKSIVFDVTDPNKYQLSRKSSTYDTSWRRQFQDDHSNNPYNAPISVSKPLEKPVRNSIELPVPPLLSRLNTQLPNPSQKSTKILPPLSTQPPRFDSDCRQFSQRQDEFLRSPLQQNQLQHPPSLQPFGITPSPNISQRHGNIKSPTEFQARFPNISNSSSVLNAKESSYVVSSQSHPPPIYAGRDYIIEQSSRFGDSYPIYPTTQNHVYENRPGSYTYSTPPFNHEPLANRSFHINQQQKQLPPPEPSQNRVVSRLSNQLSHYPVSQNQSLSNPTQISIKSLSAPNNSQRESRIEQQEPVSPATKPANTDNPPVSVSSTQFNSLTDPLKSKRGRPSLSSKTVTVESTGSVTSVGVKPKRGRPKANNAPGKQLPIQKIPTTTVMDLGSKADDASSSKLLGSDGEVHGSTQTGNIATGFTVDGSAMNQNTKESAPTNLRVSTKDTQNNSLVVSETSLETSNTDSESTKKRTTSSKPVGVKPRRGRPPNSGPAQRLTLAPLASRPPQPLQPSTPTTLSHIQPTDSLASSRSDTKNSHNIPHDNQLSLKAIKKDTDMATSPNVKCTTSSISGDVEEQEQGYNSTGKERGSTFLKANTSSLSHTDPSTSSSSSCKSAFVTSVLNTPSPPSIPQSRPTSGSTENSVNKKTNQLAGLGITAASMYSNSNSPNGNNSNDNNNENSNSLSYNSHPSQNVDAPNSKKRGRPRSQGSNLGIGPRTFANIAPNPINSNWSVSAPIADSATNNSTSSSSNNTVRIHASPTIPGTLVSARRGQHGGKHPDLSIPRTAMISQSRLTTSPTSINGLESNSNNGGENDYQVGVNTENIIVHNNADQS